MHVLKCTSSKHVTARRQATPSVRDAVTAIVARMARIEPDALQDPEQVYLAATLGEARRVEVLLTSRGVTYATQVETLGRSALFGSLRYGAGFYVNAGQAEYSRNALAQGGFSAGIVPATPDV